jgi:DHA1 family multidrug resistance protein-like MFS transporter
MSRISPRTSLITALLIHCTVEIPFFIFPVILYYVGTDIFPTLGELSWIGLGSIGTVGTLAAALPSPFFGRLADKYRRGVMMALSLLTAILGSLIIGFWGDSFLVVFIGMILMGTALAIYHPPGLSWVSSAFEDPETKSYSKNYVKILALHGIGGSLGASLGPLSVYFFIDSLNSWRDIYLLWSIPLLIVMVGFWIFTGKKEPKNSFQLTFQPETTQIYTETQKFTSNQYNQSHNLKNILYFIFFFIIAMSLTRGMINFILSIFLLDEKNMFIAEAALLVGISTLIGSTGQVIGGIVGDKYGESMVLSATALLQVLILAVIFFSESAHILLLFYILLGIMNALFWPSTNSFVARNSKRRGQAFGYVMLSANLIGALGPAIDGFLLVIDPNRYLMIFTFASLFSLSAFLSLVYLAIKLHKIKGKNSIV